MEPPRFQLRSKHRYMELESFGLQRKPALGYLLDVWGEDGKVLNLHWDDDGNIAKRGKWEEILHGVQFSLTK